MGFYNFLPRFFYFLSSLVFYVFFYDKFVVNEDFSYPSQLQHTQPSHNRSGDGKSSPKFETARRNLFQVDVYPFWHVGICTCLGIIGFDIPGGVLQRSGLGSENNNKQQAASATSAADRERRKPWKIRRRQRRDIFELIHGQIYHSS